MGRNSVPYSVALAVERILLEFSDQENRLSIRDIKDSLHEIYGIDVSKDVLLKRVIPDMEAFKLKERKPKNAETAGSEKPESEKMPIGLYPGWSINKEAASTKAKIWLEDRLFQDYEVNYLADAVASSVFLGEGKSEKLIERIQSLQSRATREDRVLHRGGEARSEKPSIYDVSLSLEILSEAIIKHRTISFDYLRYGIERVPGRVSDRREILDCRKRNGGESFEDKSPYRLQYMDDHYFLLTSGNKKSDSRDYFRVFRLDLIRNIEISDDSVLFKPLVNEDAPADYFKGAVNGFGGRPKTIELRCTEKAFHYVAERFSEFDGFKVWKSQEDPENWYRVSFKAVPKGVEYWMQKFLCDIELLKPSKTRKAILENLNNNAYRSCL